MRKLSSKSQRLIDDAVSTEAIAYWQEDQGNGSEVDASRREADAAKIKLVRHIARLEAKAAQVNPDPPNAGGTMRRP